MQYFTLRKTAQLVSLNHKYTTMYKQSTLLLLQMYPVNDLVVEHTGTALSKVHGIYGILKLVWNQTWPLFQRPNITNTFQLCYLMFVLFSIGHGTFMW